MYSAILPPLNFRTGSDSSFHFMGLPSLTPSVRFFDAESGGVLTPPRSLRCHIRLLIFLISLGARSRFGDMLETAGEGKGNSQD